MKISGFNVIKTCGDITYIYNSLTSGFVKMNTELWKSVIVDVVGSTSKESKVFTILRNAGIIIDDDYNELDIYKYKYYSSMFQDASLILSIAPTMKCNFNCFYCFENGNKNEGVMSEDIEKRLIKFISLHKFQDIHITWFGGEPLLGFERIHSICTHLKRAGINFSSDIITNGSLLTSSVIEHLDVLNLQYIQITLDGIAETHDKRRIFKNGAPSFDLIINNIKELLAKTDIPLSIKVNMDHTNPTALNDIAAFFNKNFSEYLQKDKIVISHNYVRNRTDFDKTGKCFTHEDLLRYDQEALKHQKTALIHPELPSIALPCMFRCKSSLAIDSQGNIYKCLEHLGAPNNKVGDLKSGTMSLAKLSHAMLAQNPFHSAECLHCNILPICGGGCPIDREKYIGKDKRFCSIYKENLSELLPYFYTYKYSK